MIKLKEIHIRWIGIVLLTFPIAYGLKSDEHGPMWVQLSFTFFFTAIFWNGAANIFFYYRRKFPSIKFTAKRLILTIVSLSTFLFLTSPVIRLIIGLITWQEISDNPMILTEYMWVNFSASFIVGILYETVYFFEKWKETIKQNEALKNQQIRTQFEVLQNQMSPHFLFNSLNTLTTLIAENQELAIDFTEKLSEVYRYILQNKEKELVTLKEELEFVEAYLYLLKIRYPENLYTSIQVDPVYLDSHIAPLTIQMLVENCIKHNVVNKNNPLHIEIYVQNGKSIVVKNNLQVKKVLEKSTKTGLANIKKRYAYLCDETVDIITTTQNFMVAIPLINVVLNDSHPIETSA